jgi:fibronectin-binding autotransporter adhesin
MKPKSRFPLCKAGSSKALTITIGLVASALSASAAITWDGGGADNKFSTKANWSPDAAADLTTINGQDIQIGASAQATADVNITGNINSWNFLAGLTTPMTFTASGNSMQFAAGVATPLVNSSASAQTFDCIVRQFWSGGTQTGGVANRTWNATAGSMTYKEIRLRPDAFLSTATVGGTLTFGGGFNHTVNTTMNLEGGWGTRTAGIIKNGAGTLLLKGSGNYNGSVIINAGIVRVQNNASLGTSTVTETARTDIKSGAALEIDGSLTTTEFIRVAGTGLTSTGAIRSVSGTTNLNSQIAMEGTGGATVSFGVDSGAVLKVSKLYSDTGRDTNFEKVGAGTLILKADDSNAYVGNTTITDGILQVGDGSTTGALKSSGVTNNASLVFNRSNAYNYTGGIAGTGSLTQAGSNTLTLSGTNTYTGNTNVNAGTLAISGSVDPTGTVAVAGVANLSLTGSAGPISVASGGSLTHNGSSSSVTFASNGSFSGEGSITGDLSVAGSFTSDSTTGGAVTVSGTMTLTGTTNVVLTGSPAPGTYLIATFGSLVNPGSFTSGYRGATFSFTGTTASLTITGGIPLSWNGFTDSSWDTTGSLNWLDSTPGNQNFQNGDLVTFGEGGANPAVVLTGDLRPGSIIANASTTDYSFSGSGAINGDTGLVKSGLSTLTIATANGYTGTTVLNDGRLRVGNDLALGTGAVTLNGGTISSDSATARVLGNTGLLTFGTALTIGDSTDTGALTFASPSATLTGDLALTLASDATVTSAIGDGLTGYGFTKLGSGTLTLSGTSTFSGTVSLDSGRVRAGATNALGTGTIVFNGGGLSSNGTTARTLANAVSLPIDPTFGNAVDTGTITLTGALALPADRTITTLSRTILSGPVSGAFNLTKAGTSSLGLGGSNSYSGSSTINAGVLQIRTANSLPSGSAVTVASGSSLEIAITSGTNKTFDNPIAISGPGASGTRGALWMSNDNSANSNNHTFTGGIVLGGNTTFGSFGVSMGMTFNSVISGTGNLTFNVEGASSSSHNFTATFNQANTYSGNTNLASGAGNRGFYVLGVNNALPVATVVNLNASTGVLQLNLNGKSQTLAGLTSSGTLANDTVVGAGSLTIDNAATNTFGGVLGGAGSAFSLTKSNSGTLVLTGVNTFTGGTTIADGPIQMSGSGRLSATTGSLAINTGGALDLNGTNQTVDVLSGSSTSGNAVYNSVNASTSTLTVGSNGGSGSFDGVITNTNSGGTGLVAITKIGVGIQTLTGTNTYSGATTVNAGTLRINGNQGGATGAVNVSATATLGGTGTLGGLLTVSSGGSVSPGETFGTLNASNGAVVAGTYACQVDGSSVDTLAVTGNLDLTGATLAVTPSGTGATESSYVIATYTGTLTGTFTVSPALPVGYSVSYSTPGQIKLVSGTPFSTWAGTTHGLTGDGALAGSDPDGDGVKNIVEFALNGNPTSGSNNGLTSTLIQDASSPAGDELTYTLAVRDGATFSSGAGGSQTATVDGVIYTVQGSVDLSAFTSAVSVIGSASDTAAGLPSLAGTSWEYRTFKLDASEGLGGKGFLRVKIETAP